MATRKIETEPDVEALAESGELGWGALVRDGEGIAWLAFDTEDGPRALRPLNEGDDPDRRTPVGADLEDLTLPLYVTIEDRNAVRHPVADALAQAADKIGPYTLSDPAVTDPATGEYVQDSSMAIMLAPDGEDAATVRGYLRALAEEARR